MFSVSLGSVLCRWDQSSSVVLIKSIALLALFVLVSCFLTVWVMFCSNQLWCFMGPNYHHLLQTKFHLSVLFISLFLSLSLPCSPPPRFTQALKTVVCSSPRGADGGFICKMMSFLSRWKVVCVGYRAHLRPRTRPYPKTSILIPFIHSSLFNDRDRECMTSLCRKAEEPGLALSLSHTHARPLEVHVVVYTRLGSMCLSSSCVINLQNSKPVK